jgi:hypothetical protein
MTLTWTQIALSTGEPALYRLKTGTFGGVNERWDEQTIVCDRTIRGTEPGAPISCVAHGFEPGTPHAFRLGSFGIEDGGWVDFEYSNIVGGRTHSHEVTDLNVIEFTSSTLTFFWTQVDDGNGTGDPAWYRLKYGSPLEDWREGTIGCDRNIEGTAIGEELRCTIEGLEQNTTYEVQLGSYRLEDGAWSNFRLSNVAQARTGVAAGGVDDLRVTGETATSLTMTWTQIDDGTGNPARYRVKYTQDNYDADYRYWTVGCNVTGTQIGEPISCTFGDLHNGSWFVQLVSYRLVDGVWEDAQYSNITRGSIHF